MSVTAIKISLLLASNKNSTYKDFDFCMSNSSTIDRELIALKRKLESAIDSKTITDDQLKHQHQLFTDFIIKLSQTCKGIDISLDNKLAKLRTLFNKSADIEQIEVLTNDISHSLQNFSLKNDNDIRQLQHEFLTAGGALQKINGLPSDLRRKLRTLLKDNQESKDALTQYVPLLTQLLSFYQATLKKGNITDQANVPISTSIIPATNTQPVTDLRVIRRFSEFLDKINVSQKYQTKLRKIRAELKENMPNEQLLDSFLAAFDLLSHDLLQQRNSAKVFLSTLSEALTTVQTAVGKTLHVHQKHKQQHQQLNQQLQGQLRELSSGLEQANSLVDIKVDINSKLKAIAATIEQKSHFETEQQGELEHKLIDMQSKVNDLEQQSKNFEQRIKEQHAKSLQDALTKLYNRAAFDEHFAREIVRCQHNRTPLALVVADLDNFKRINDTYGHTAGDKTLQVIANTFKKYLEDISFIARYGGEEFVVIFTDQDKTSLLNALNSLREKVEKLPFKFKNNKVSMTFSAGVTFVKQEDNVHIAFERADTALYQAKANGKNQVIYLE